MNKVLYQGNNWISLDIETKGVSRVNTIAIYDDTVFSEEYGHYYQNEKMSLVILDVSSSSRIFEKGINVIVIPTSIFVNTKLHGIIETSVDENGNISNDTWNNDFPSYLKGAKIAGIDRNELTDTVSSNVECILSRNATSSEARNILEKLILTSSNESEGMIYFYTDNSRAEDLGLSIEVLELIPLDMKDYVNDPTGEWPRTPWENFIQLVVTIVKFIIDVLIAVITFFIDLFTFIAEVGMNLVETITQAALAIVEAVIKAIILAFIYLMFALELLSMVIANLALFVFLVPMILIMGGTFTFDIFSLTLTTHDLNVAFTTEFVWVYNEFLDLDVPVIIRETLLNGQVIASATLGVIDDKATSELNGYQNTGSSLVKENSVSEISSEMPQSASPGPELVGSVSPEKGHTLTDFVFVAVYSNDDNHAPFNRENANIVIIDENNVPVGGGPLTIVNSGDTNYTDGFEYNYTTQLRTAGKYKYYFEVEEQEDLFLKSDKYKLNVSLSDADTYNLWFDAVGFITTITATCIFLVAAGSKDVKIALAGSIVWGIAVALFVVSALLVQTSENTAFNIGVAWGFFFAFIIMFLFGVGNFFKIGSLTKLSLLKATIFPIATLIFKVLGKLALFDDNLLADFIFNVASFIIGIILLTAASILATAALRRGYGVEKASKGIYWFITFASLLMFIIFLVIVSQSTPLQY
jgi:hypothetical protein